MRLAIPISLHRYLNQSDITPTQHTMAKSIVGTLPIEHYVDPNGSLSLHVPIKVPPAKLSPEISVSYHSAISELSVLGAGWDLQAFGLIQRTGATIAQDSFAGKSCISYLDQVDRDDV